MKKCGLSYLLAFALLVNLLSFSFVSAAPAQDVALPSMPVGIPAIVNEDDTLREQNMKYFRLSDGSYTVAIYDEPIHYRQGNEWVEIDNSFVSASLTGEPLTGTIKRDSELTEYERRNISRDQQNVNLPYNIEYFENKANDFHVQLPKEINSNTPIVVSYGGHSLRFRFNSITNTAAEVTQPGNTTAIAQELQNKLAETTNSHLRVKIENDFATAVQKNRSSVSYASVKNNIDLNYYVSGQSLKEDIVFHSLPSTESFSFDFTYTGLTAVLEEDKSVVFYDELGASVFVIAAPFMFDSDEGYSSDILVTLEQTGTGCRYTLTPNREWLEDTERVYPVTLDPQVATTQNTSYIHDNGVQQSDPNTNYITADRVYVGSGPNSKQGRMYFKLTQWPSATGLNADTITSASLNLSYYPQASWQTAYQTTIDVYKVSSSWDTNTITWNNQTGIGGTLVSSKFISDSRNKTSGYDTFDVIAWVKSHYSSPSTDYGIRLQPRTVDSSTNRACYISSDYSTTASRPIIKISYTPSSGTAPGITSGALYYIRNVNSGKYLDVKNGSRDVVQHSLDGGAHQKWKVLYESDGFYSFSPVGSANNVLDLANGSASNGNPLWSYKKWASNTVESNAQRFVISQVGTNRYKIASKKDTNKVVEVRSASTAEDATVQLWDYVGQTQQQWVFERVKTATCSREVTSIPADDSYDTAVRNSANRYGQMPTDEYLLKRTSLMAAIATAKQAAQTVAPTYPVASSMLLHFLDDTGTTYTLPSDFIKNSSDINAKREEVFNALNGAYSTLRVPDITVYYGNIETIKYRGGGANTDWKLAVNKCELWGKVTAVGTTSKQTTLYVRDFYDWQAGDMTDLFDVAADILNQCHYAGLARDFPVVGSATY